MTDNKSRLLSLLGMSRKAGKLSTGFEAVRESAQRGKSCLILCSSDLSEKTVKELKFASNGKCSVIVTSLLLDEITRAVGTKTGCLSVNDKGFADAINKLTVTTKED